ncbi:unnamed protein product [Schistosoma turkestanicum]|nr:unnamed protein product [Schistosoma turkestanicum]
MLHSPLSNPFSSTCSSTTTSKSNECFKPDLTVLESAIPFFTKPLLSIASFANTNHIPGSTSTPFFFQPASQVQAHQHTSNFGNINSSNLSGSSSLSSSLISLHSTSNGLTNQQFPTSPVSIHSNHVSSGSRDSRWLKLRVCTSVSEISTSPLQNNAIKSEKEFINSENKCSLKLEDTSTKIKCSSTTNCENENEPSFHCSILGSTCPYAHPPVTVRVENGYVTVCYDFIKRKLCKFSYCKYYHPPPHQIEAIIRRGDEQKKLLESQQRLSDLKTSSLVPMQPLQQTLPTGLPTLSSAASCPSSFRWPPTTLLQPSVGGSVYGTYLTPLNSVPDPASLSASALLAAAAVIQQANQGAGVLPTSSTLSSSSIFPHDSVISKSTINNDTSAVVSEPSSLSFNNCNIVTCLANPLSNCQIQQYQSLQQQQAGAANLPPTTWSVAASTPTTSAANYVSSIVTSYSEVASNTAACPLTSLIRAGMKREADITLGNFENDLEMHNWLPTKRANMSTSSSLDRTSQNRESTVVCNGDEKLESSFRNSETKCQIPDSGTSFPTVFTCGSLNPGFTPLSSCANIGTSHVSPEVTNMINPLNISIYGLPFSQPGASLYAPQFIYPPLHSMNNGCDAPTSMASAAAALALNNFLIQQQQQLQSHQLLRIQLPTVTSQQLSGPGLYSSYIPPPTLATATALAAAHQPLTHDHTNVSNTNFQQQQQALLLTLILRSQQAQLAAAQVAAAGYLSQNDTSRLPPIPTLQNHGCVLDSSCPVPGPLGTLSSGPYGTSFCSQNPMTNVAYVNEKGHLLETLPICRDFKAGKCRRNSECRYVHLVDENVEVNQGRVTVCRDAAKGRCTRVPCKYYHIPLFAISANRSMALNSALASVTGFPTISTL